MTLTREQESTLRATCEATGVLRQPDHWIITLADGMIPTADEP
jgi:hypothetical protein